MQQYTFSFLWPCVVNLANTWQVLWSVIDMIVIEVGLCMSAMICQWNLNWNSSGSDNLQVDIPVPRAGPHHGSSHSVVRHVHKIFIFICIKQDGIN